MSGGASPTFVRGLYRRMLQLARGIPDATRRADATRSIRKGFRENAVETDEQVVSELLEEAQKHVSFMKIVGRRHPGAGGLSGARKQAGKVSYIRDPKTGKWVTGTVNGTKPASTGGGHWGQVTSEHVRRASALNRRQHFGGPGRN